jgi:hypothetical protein
MSRVNNRARIVYGTDDQLTGPDFVSLGSESTLKALTNIGKYEDNAVLKFRKHGAEYMMDVKLEDKDRDGYSEFTAYAREGMTPSPTRTWVTPSSTAG